MSLAACSRENDVIFPSPPDEITVDCSIPSLSPNVVEMLQIRARGVDGREAQLLFSDSQVENVDTTAGINIPNLVSELYFTVDTINADTEVALIDDASQSPADGLIAPSTAVISAASASFPSQGQIDVEDNIEASYPLEVTEGSVLLNVSYTYTIREERDECKFLGTEESEDKKDENGDPVLDEDGNPEQESFVARSVEEQFDFIFELSREDFDDNIIVTDTPPNRLESGVEQGSAVSFNGSVLAIGSPAETTPNGTGAGVVYLYQYDMLARTFSQCAVLEASNARAQDRFGSKVLIRGDRLFVSAPGEDSSYSGFANVSANDPSLSLNYSQIDSGAVYEFSVDSSCASTEVGYLKSPDNQNNLAFPIAGFGASLAEVDGDLFVGSPLQRFVGPAPSSDPNGAVYQFFRDADGFWVNSTRYTSAWSAANQNFGAAISVSSDYVLIGAPGDASASDDLPLFNGLVDPSFLSDNIVPALALNSGAATLFTKGQLNVVPSTLGYLKVSSSDPGDQFGAAVSIVDSTLFIGAPFEDSPSSLLNFGAELNQGPPGQTPLDGNYGAVYRYDINEEDGAITIGDYIKSQQPEQGENFGAVLAAERRFLAVANSIAIDVNGLSGVDTHVELIDYTTYNDPVYLSVFEKVTDSNSIPETVDSIDLYGGSLVLGLPNASLDGNTDSGAFAYW